MFPVPAVDLRSLNNSPLVVQGLQIGYTGLQTSEGDLLRPPSLSSLLTSR